MEGFSFILSHDIEGSLTLTTAPEGFKEIEYVITRSENKYGLFSSFSGSLGFLREGKTFIDNIIDTYDINQIITLTIKYRNPVTLIREVFLTGILDLSTEKRERFVTNVAFEDTGFRRKIRSRSNVNLKYNASESIEGESLSLSNPYEDIVLRYIDALGVEQTDTVKTILPYNAFKSIIQQITDSGYEVLQSSILGRTEDGYSIDGDLSYRTLQDGKLLRGYEESDGNRINFSLDQLFDAFNKQKPIGLGFSVDESGRDVVSIEERFDFFESDVLFTLDNSRIKKDTLTFSPAMDLIYKAIKIGYQDFPKDNENGLTEYNTRSEWVSPITVSENDLNLINEFRADGTSINDILNNFKKVDTDPEGSDYDDDIFIIDAYKDGLTIKNSTNEDYTSISGIYDNSTLYYNLDLTPQRILETQYAEWINIGLQKLTGKKIKHTFAKTLEDLETLKIGDVDTVTENTDIEIDNLPTPRLSGRLIEVGYAFKQSEIALINTSPRKIIKLFNSHTNTYSYGWIKEISTKPIDGNTTNVSLYEVGDITLLTGFLKLQTDAYLLLQTGGKIKLHG